MKPHTVSVILAFGAAMWLIGYYAPLSQQMSYVALGIAGAFAGIFGIIGVATYHE